MRSVFLGIVLWTIFAATPSQAQLLADITDAPASLTETSTSIIGKRLIARVETRPIFTSFTGLAVEIFSTSVELEGKVRFDDSGVWGEWISLYFVRSATNGFHIAGFYGERVWSSTRFQLEVSGPSNSPIIFGSAGVFDNRLDDDRHAPTPSPLPQENRAIGGFHITPPALITRSNWGADPFVLGNPVPLANPSYDYMTFHHAAGFSATTFEEGLVQVKAIQDLHQNIRGWSDIGYQFIIDRSGRVYQGRPFLDSSTTLAQGPVLARGAHVGGFNTGNIGICMLGCYHPSEGSFCQEVPTTESLQTFVTLFAFLSDRYGPAAANIRGHRDWSSTACPGDNNYPLLPTVRADVETLLITGNQAVATAELSAKSDEAGTIRISWIFIEDFGVETYRLERTHLGETTVIFAGIGAETASFADPEITDIGTITYALYAHAEDGRVQRVASVDVEINFPEVFLLSEVFPNPAHTNATLRYFLAHDGVVRISLFDVSGREVQLIEDRFEKGNRWYLSKLNTASLASGMYFYRIRVDGFAGIVFDETRSIAVIN